MKHLKEALKEFDIDIEDKNILLSYTTDKTASLVKCFRECENSVNVICFAHTLHLCI